MTRDAFDPGPNGTYLAFPRNPATGAPLWSDSAETDGQPVNGVAPMPRGLRREGDGRGGVVLVNVTPRGPGGVPIDPPTIPPA